MLRRPAADVADERLVRALRLHGWPWQDDRDAGGAFRRGSEDHPDQSAEEHTLLRERRAALERDEPAHAANLRHRLQAGGLVVRDRGGRQEVQGTQRPGGGHGTDR